MVYGLKIRLEILLFLVPANILLVVHMITLMFLHHSGIVLVIKQ